jgi:hypothetical protein
MANRTRFLEKMREPQMQKIIWELSGQRWHLSAKSLTTMVKRITRGEAWLPGKVHGAASYLNAEEILMLKDRIRTMEPLASADFVEVAGQIHEEGLRLSARWLRALHHLTQADKVTVEAEEAEARSRTWVTRLVQRCQLVLRAGEDLGADREEWGKVIVIQEWFRHYSPTIQDVPEVLRLNGDEVGVVIQERGKLVCLPGCRLFRLRGKKLPHFIVFPVFNCFGDGPTPFIVIPEFRSAQARLARIHRRKVSRSPGRDGSVTRSSRSGQFGSACGWRSSGRITDSWANQRPCSWAMRQLVATARQCTCSGSTT